MFKYIKWELINEFKSKLVMFGVIAIVYLLIFIIPNSSLDANVITSFITLSFSIILFITFALTFIYGAKRTMDSYKNQTFLLESMIPLSPSKLLLAKYILAILFDFIFCLIFILGFAVILAKDNINLFQNLIQYFFNTNVSMRTIILRAFLLTITSTIAFTSFISLLFIGIKSFFPNGKGIKAISYIVGLFLLSTISDILRSSFNTSSNFDLIYSLTMIILTILCYRGSVWFIENKLEVYN